LFGNARDMAASAFLGTAGFGLLLALAALKPLVTTLCLGIGASGGLLLPRRAPGLSWAAPRASPGALPGPDRAGRCVRYRGRGGDAGAAMQAPLAALALMLELAGGRFSVMIPPPPERPVP
jgi:H+/Cl- antiporter ClcA